MPHRWNRLDDSILTMSSKRSCTVVVNLSHRESLHCNSHLFDKYSCQAYITMASDATTALRLSKNHYPTYNLFVAYPHPYHLSAVYIVLDRIPPLITFRCQCPTYGRNSRYLLSEFTAPYWVAYNLLKFNKCGCANCFPPATGIAQPLIVLIALTSSLPQLFSSLFHHVVCTLGAPRKQVNDSHTIPYHCHYHQHKIATALPVFLTCHIHAWRRLMPSDSHGLTGRLLVTAGDS